MRYAWIAALMLGALPAVSEASRGRSGLSFSFGLGYSDYRYADYGYARGGYDYGYYRPSYYESARYYRPSYYCESPPVYYSRPTYYYSSTYYAPYYSSRSYRSYDDGYAAPRSYGSVRYYYNRR